MKGQRYKHFSKENNNQDKTCFFNIFTFSFSYFLSIVFVNDSLSIRVYNLNQNVVSIQHQPKNWIRMNIVDNEVKIMEIKKYSSIYFDLATKINRPGYELISGYTIQNPFLMGSYMLRKEQMQMQLGKSGAKEKYLFFPIYSFRDIDKICRMNGNIAKTILSFYLNACDAMEMHEKSKPKSNPRALLYSRVLLGQCSLNNNTKKKQFFEMEKGTGLPMNSWTNEDHDCEENDGPGDTHKPRLESFLSNTVAISYRTGKKYNPEEDLWHQEDKKIKREITSESTTQAVIEMIPLSKLNITSDEKESSAQEDLFLC
ncbi:unnamed protein product [Lepeophtheirus salmonis]|uniref:(salmon louse) hypothetical protein n=1 Tax=Lepeophtheirus salmonis TaxID=72036 RepID=A0A7R8D1K8_LEPSM|nr:unnamed protein product [Lepeophtheirus salmonis]CAF2996645.1 unnamed protein product [Lepeophtheirus salmonis]